jgi:hypothetical protein
MSIQEETIAKINQLPESLIQEVNNFVDFLLMRQHKEQWQQWIQFSESSQLAESDFCEYLSNLEDYEDKLARGEIEW